MSRVADEYQNALERVAAYFSDHFEEWIPGYVIASPEVGGSEGLRRKRDLQLEYGWIIKKQKMANSNAYEYKLVGFE